MTLAWFKLIKTIPTENMDCTLSPQMAMKENYT